jgi:CRISPR-associated protein Cmr4
MNSKVLYLLTRTPLHVGAGASVGAIDQPVVRERHTGFPMIPGSSIKGVLADLHLADRGRGLRSEDGIHFFGRQDHEVVKGDPALQHQAGSISFSEARLLAFPVRSARGCFAWVTSPLLIERWRRDAGGGCNLPEQRPQGDEVYGPQELCCGEEQVVLEDYALRRRGAFEPGKSFQEVIQDSFWREMGPGHLCLISDDLMAHYAQAGCEIVQHVCIDDETGAAADHKLFNQENVPSDSLFYSVLKELRSGTMEKFGVPPVLQVGGDATTGLGFCSTWLV